MPGTQPNINHSVSEDDQDPAPVGTGRLSNSSGDAKAETKSPPRFGYMFPDLKPFCPPDESLIKLGEAMLKGPDLGEHPTLPSGYTYLGQFIAHDISLNRIEDIPRDLIDANDLENGRTPFLDLDGIYGMGSPGENKKLYEDDLIHLIIGSTDEMIDGIGNNVASRTYKNDLPRTNPKKRREATIGDPRNDENLALAQIHVAFLRFHNSVIERIKQESFFDSNRALFKQARKKVIQHYQWIILNDFLPKIIEGSALRKAINIRLERPRLESVQAPSVPVEFSAAAFRLGHSLLRESYEWNRLKQSPRRSENSRMAELSDLFRFTGRNGTMGGGGGNVLPSDWIIDWTRFFDFTGFNGIANNPKFNRARKIDTTLTPVLKELSDFLKRITNPEFRSLPVLDLVRGSRLGLPSGQAVANKIGLTPLTPTEVAQEPHQDVLRLYGLDKKTPLWYYILKEAQVYHGGKLLGPVGSYITAKTFVDLIWASPNSILKEEDWEPDLGQKERREFGMADLLILANVVNPLGS